MLRASFLPSTVGLRAMSGRRSKKAPDVDEAVHAVDVVVLSASEARDMEARDNMVNMAVPAGRDSMEKRMVT